MTPIRPETAVPPGETPAARCRYCERPFRTEQAHALHLGEAHDEECTPDEREAYERATEEEEDDLFLFHMKVVIALGLLYAGFVLGYMVLVQSF